MPNRNRKPLEELTPADALRMLKEGNFRYVNNLHISSPVSPDYIAKQEPFAAILSCMDSRTAAELIFDLGMGDVFSIRIAGNVVSENVLGSLEYATAVVGSKLIMVLGHTECGAVKGACDNVQLGNLTTLLDKIKPALGLETTVTQNRTSQNKEFVDAVALQNVLHTIEEIYKQSPVISKLVAEDKLNIVPAMYDVQTGKVTFYDEKNQAEKTVATATAQVYS